MKINHPVRKLVLLVIILFVIYIGPTIYSGYEMYVTAVNHYPLQEKIESLEAMDSYITIEEVNEGFIKLVIESEDQDFYAHHGFSIQSTMRAIVNNIKAMDIIEGGSTISQQLAKNLYFTFERRFDRKVAELFVVKDLERTYTKNQILEYYLNIAYFGYGNVGLKSAANYYYQVDPKDLTIEQSKALVRTLKSPNNYNPIDYNKKNDM